MPQHRRCRLYACWVYASLILGACDGNGATVPTPVPEQGRRSPPVAAEPEAEDPAPQVPKEPSNTPTETWTEAWATPTGHETTHVAAIHEGRIYALAGQYLAFGWPSDHLVCLAEDTGERLWTFKGSEMLTLKGFGAGVVVVSTHSGATTMITTEKGKAVRPPKDPTEPYTVRPVDEGAGGCTAQDRAVTCEGWTITEASDVSRLSRSGDRVCYGIEGAREVRCRSATSGDLLLSIAVPSVPGIKNPDSVNYSVHIRGDRLIIGNYDGTVLAYTPGAG